MTDKKVIFYFSLLVLTFPLALASDFQQLPAINLAVLPSAIADASPVRRTIHFQPPPDRSRPRDDTAGGGTRGECPQDMNSSLPLTLLLPTSQMGLTIAERPTFFAYIPQTQARIGEFVLYDETQKAIAYQTRFSLSKTPGIVRLQIPSNRPALAINKTYQWRFLLHCKPNDRAVDTFRVGWVKRIAAHGAIAKVQRQGDPIERAQVYAANGIWYDALKTLAELRPAASGNSNATIVWQQLLQSEFVRLDAIASQPFLQCCQPEN